MLCSRILALVIQCVSSWVLGSLTGLFVCEQLISDAGYQGEITSVSTACHQIEVFSKVLRTFISGFLIGGDENREKTLEDFTVGFALCVSCILNYVLIQSCKIYTHLTECVMSPCEYQPSWLFCRFQKMVCHGEHTYLYCQLMMHILSQEPKAGANIRRLCQEVHQYAQNK